ncbi:hypothetical protein [Nostoc sp. 2RC]|uniref:hypothetical protein n=1 Tax=Nostoc sp. 2RC TaxID=2485484 RepID=UPI0016255A52|nr:hypothetical protein [Nostoc sp. 2RC]MBC1237537.1 hypothetical protein [Nostoc sp. 2RC]
MNKSENQDENYLLHQIRIKLEGLKNYFSKLSREELRNYLSQLSLDNLSGLTQQIGNQVSETYFLISMIVAELIKRAKKNEETFDVEARGKAEIVKVWSSMSEEDEKKVTEFIIALLKNKEIVKFKLSSQKKTNSELHTEVKQFWDENQKIQQELDRLKGK